jgi:hypothetical protein
MMKIVTRVFSNTVKMKNTLSFCFQVGYYMVKSREEKFPKVVFCDMTRSNLITVEASESRDQSYKPFHLCH